MIFDVQATSDPRDIVHRTVQALVEGQVVGVPTETVYGLAASSLCEKAVERLCELKGCSEYNPLAISVRSCDAALDFMPGLSSLGRRLSQRCWPGPLTLVVPHDSKRSAANHLPAAVQRRVLGADGCLGIRVVDHRILAHIQKYLSAPLILTSACNNGSPLPTTAKVVAEEFGTQLPLLLDDGPTRYGGASTVVQIVGNRWELLREGVIEQAAMNQFAKPVIVLVCTGNTCRSPMAQTLLREHIRRRFGDDDAVRVMSAGVAAGSNSGASPQAIEVMDERGLDLGDHCSRPLDDAVMNVADLVLTMTRGHRAAILAAWPEMHDRVFTLRRDGGDVSDPVGMSVEVYRACAEQIEEELLKWLPRLEEEIYPESQQTKNHLPDAGSEQRDNEGDLE
jgi:tRNA threonylcarbamoyl adenosine modification protein (Sua5/YciO/YrdC/YwlC family)